MIYNFVVVTRPGQCGSCGAWRTDGKPPTVHFTRCSAGPDGFQIGPIGQGTWWRDRQAEARSEPGPPHRKTRR